MKDDILKDFIMYQAIEILKENIKIDYNKEDERILGDYYEIFITNNINNNRNDNKRFYKCKRRR